MFYSPSKRENDLGFTEAFHLVVLDRGNFKPLFIRFSESF